jgi:hypothetical protein
MSQNREKPSLAICNRLLFPFLKIIPTFVFTMKAILGVLSAFLMASNTVLAFTATTTKPQTTSEIFQGLQNTKLIRADGISTTLTSQWRQNTPFGVADETAVVAFLRHFG